MTADEFAGLAAEARRHATNAQNDIRNASTRIEHLRLTALAIEADNIARRLETISEMPSMQGGQSVPSFQTGLEL